MRIAIIGIGGVGGYFGSKLARAYAGSEKHEIIFIARGEHLRSMQQKGLQLFTQEGDYVAWPNIATDQPDIAGPFDLAFFCVKSYSLESSAQLLMGNIKKETVVVPLLNGVDSAERLRTILPHADVISGSCYIISHMEKPGIIHQKNGACKLIFGTDDSKRTQKYAPILDILLQANIKAVLTDKISEALWTKFLLMCPLASLTSFTGKTYGEIWTDTELRKKARDLMMEVVAVARARNVLLSEDIVDKTMEMVARFDHNSKTSMQLDREKDNQTEIDTLTAFLCRAGLESGIPTPLHDEIYKQLIG